jgi:hypothetical protein
MHSEVEVVVVFGRAVEMGTTLTVVVAAVAAAAVVVEIKNETIILHYHHSLHPFFYCLQ